MSGPDTIDIERISMTPRGSVGPELSEAMDHYVDRHSDAYKLDVDVAVERIRDIKAPLPLDLEFLPKRKVRDALGVDRIIGFDFRTIDGIAAYQHLMARRFTDLEGVFDPLFTRLPFDISVVEKARFRGSTAVANVITSPVGYVNDTHLFMRELRHPGNTAVLARELATIDPLVWALAAQPRRQLRGNPLF